jgi:hypothetical protein
MIGLHALDSLGVSPAVAREVALLFFRKGVVDIYPELATTPQREEEFALYSKHREIVDRVMADLFPEASGLSFEAQPQRSAASTTMDPTIARRILDQAADSLERAWCQDPATPTADIPKSMILDEAISWAWSDAGNPPGLDHLHESIHQAITSE